MARRIEIMKKAQNDQNPAPVKDYDDEAVKKARGIETDEDFQNRRKVAAAFGAGQGVQEEEAAGIADKEAFKAQQGALVENGMKPEQAFENLLDRKMAQFCTWFENNAPKFVEKGCEVVGTLIGTFMGSSRAGRILGKKVGRVLSRHPIVRNGIRKIASYAKTFYEKAKKAVSKAVQTGKAILQGAKKILCLS
jgi:hypothetical protein